LSLPPEIYAESDTPRSKNADFDRFPLNLTSQRGHADTVFAHFLGGVATAAY